MKSRKGTYGQHLKFNYRINWWRGARYVPKTQITPDTVTTNTFGNLSSYSGGGSYSGSSYSTVTPGASFGGFTIPAGMRTKLWFVEVDCIDYTVNHVGDGGGWVKFNRKGGLSYEGLTTKDIADEFCPQMDRLVSEALGR